MLHYRIQALVCHTKKYKYGRCKTQPKIRDVRGAIIEKVILIAVLALAIAVIPIMAQEASTGGKGTDVLGDGIFESGDNTFNFPILTDTNFDSITVGNDNAHAFAWDADFPFINDPAKAENNLEIKKNQQVGPCECCDKSSESTYTDGIEGGLNNCSPCQDCCTTVNIDQVHVGDRNANAFGLASAVNNVKLVLNQAP